MIKGKTFFGKIKQFFKKTSEIQSKENNSTDADIHSDYDPIMIDNYGQVRTMADILIGLNKKHHFSGHEEAISAVEKFIASQNNNHSSISAMAFHIIADTLKSPLAFVDGKLNDAEIRKVFDVPRFQNAWKNALYKYRFAKLWKLICYFNEFRRYSTPDEIIEDLKLINLQHYFIMTDNAWGTGDSGLGGYPWHFFRSVIREMWDAFAPLGVLNTKLLNEYMFENHEISVRTIGLEATLKRDFVQDYCHKDVFSPKKVGTAPVYIGKMVGSKNIFVKSCGEGKGPNQCPELFEIRYAQKLLLDDLKYDVWGFLDFRLNFCPAYFIPKHDYSLPIYGTEEKILFEDEQAKRLFIEEVKKDSHLYIATDREKEEIAKEYKF